jgi:hypothetical protein
MILSCSVTGFRYSHIQYFKLRVFATTIPVVTYSPRPVETEHAVTYQLQETHTVKHWVYRFKFHKIVERGRGFTAYIDRFTFIFIINLKPRDPTLYLDRDVNCRYLISNFIISRFHITRNIQYFTKSLFNLNHVNSQRQAIHSVSLCLWSNQCSILTRLNSMKITSGSNAASL